MINDEIIFAQIFDVKKETILLLEEISLVLDLAIKTGIVSKIVGLPKERHVATLSHIKYCQKMSSDNASGATSSYPALDATSPTDSVIQGDFGTLSAQEQERQRDEWKAELAKTEEEIITLKQVIDFEDLSYSRKNQNF